MWITSDVDLPQAVLDAQSDGRLVFFVGAGASVDAPSGLPLFKKLACQLAEMARIPFDEEVAIDFFLGSMPLSFDTHRHARDIISRSDSAPNTTHAALIRVASSVGQLRMVTTNFDNHLSSAAAAEGIEVSDTWVGPALPLGDDFAGIVHLHGSVLREPRELVLTDADFGRAYLTNAWATRFLLPMFHRYTVVFIGYSHDDPIMQYLGLGLPSGTPRYAFTDVKEVSASKWSRLGVRTIGYPVQEYDHGSLIAALEAWDLRTRMGRIEHHARITELVEGGPMLSPVDYDYLVSQLETANGAREFVQAVAAVEQARQVAWLHWAEGFPGFQANFTGQDGDTASSILGYWFCQSYIAVPELHGAALQTVQRLGQAFGNDLFNTAGWTAGELSKVDADAGRRWKAFLSTSVHGHSAPVDMKTLLPYLPADSPEDLTMLRAALKSYLVLKRRWFLDASDDLTTIPDAEVHWNTDEDSLTGHVLKAIDGTAPGDCALGTVLEDSLSAAYDLLDGYHGERAWDPLSFSRSAIERHEQNQLRNPVDAIIDGLRAYGERALLEYPDLPDRWWSLDRAIFQRLALHLIAADVSKTADEKISWLLKRSVLYETNLKHEAYRVLKVATEMASGEVRTRLLAAAQAAPSLPEDIQDHDRQAAYRIYNLLVWLAQVAPGWAEAGAALAKVQAANSDFSPRSDPDFDHWTSGGVWGGKPPMELDDFIASIEADPSSAISGLLSRDYSKLNFDEPEWRDALLLVTRVAASRPELGAQIWTVVDGSGESEGQRNDLNQAIIEGWATAALDGVADIALERVATRIAHFESARTISRFLLEQVRQQIESEETPALAAMRRIAVNLWTQHGKSFTHSAGEEPNSSAPLFLNSWPGDLAQYWTVEVDRRWRKHRDNWLGLTDEEHDAMAELLSGPHQALDATRPAMARQLYFLFAADEAFTTKHILPLFRDDTTANLVWNPYLHGPRYNDKMLKAGLLDSTIAEWDRLETLGDAHLQSQFFGLVTSIVSFAGITPESRQDLLDQSVLVADGAHEARFVQEVARFLRADGIDGAKVWKEWVRDHLKARLNDLPRILNTGELTCWAEIVPYVGDAIPEAIDLLDNRNIGLGSQPVVREFSKTVLAAHGPVLVSFFAERIRNSTPSNYAAVYQVRNLIDKMRAALGDEGVQPLLGAATEKGFPTDGMEA